MKQPSRWTILSLIFMLTLAFALAYQSIPPILGFIISAFELSHAQAGALMSLFALPGIFVSIPGGILANVYGAKRVGVASLATIFAGTLLVAFSNGFPMLVAGRILSGIGGMTIAIMAPQTLAQWFAKKNLGMAMGIFHGAVPIMTILTLNTFGRLAQVSSWELPVLLTSVFSLLALVVFALKYPAQTPTKGFQKEAGPEFHKELVGTLRSGWPLWVMALIWMMFNAAAIAYLTFAGDYFVSVGYSIGLPGFFTSLIMVGGFIFGLLTGLIVDRVGREIFFIAGGSALMAVTIFLIPRSSLHPWILGSLVGIADGLVPSPTFSLIAKLSPGDQPGSGLALAATLANVGVLIGPYLVGLAYDRTLSHRTVLDVIALFALMTAILALIVPILVRKQKKLVS
ncbi:MAG: MFS transporter [Clostridiaceae bacterium]|nr:MFS transporter [Clostridiaceae bacterium]